MTRWLITLVLALYAAALARDRLDRWVAATDLPPVLGETSVEMRDRNGALLRVYTVGDGLWRLDVTPAKVDPLFRKMLVAYEDRRFDSHHGVDLRAILRAGVQALLQGRMVSGASTLTMQVARLIEDSGTGRWQGKLRQMRVALALERHLSKDDILRLYLLHAPYGGNVEGIRAASLAWFNKDPRRLTPAEAALLVALPQAPEARRPDRNMPAAIRARDRVLDRAIETGVLTAEAAAAAHTSPIPADRRAFARLAPHLTDRVRAENPVATRHDLTLDAAVQTGMETLARQSIRDLPQGASVAIVVADHRDATLIAAVGSPGYDAASPNAFVDMVRASRSPGSTLKPLVYGLAFDRGLAHPQTLIDDRPMQFGTYAPQNFDGTFQGQMRVADALRQSRNLPVVLLTQEVGPAHLMAAMRRADMHPQLPGGRAGLAVALGGVGVSLMDLTSLYASLAQGGEARALRNRLDGPQTEARRVISPKSAWYVGDILSGLAPPPGAPRNRLAYKTGTSYGHRDAWAIGFDGRHVVGVWVGRPDGTPLPGAFGADLAAPILFDAFQRLKPELDPLPPPPADALIVSTAQLPDPLREFRGRGAVFDKAPDAPKFTFPPDGARLALTNGELVVKVRDGRPPFTWLADGAPVLTGAQRREAQIDGLRPGFSKLSVIDALGRSSTVSVRLD